MGFNDDFDDDNLFDDDDLFGDDDDLFGDEGDDFGFEDDFGDVDLGEGDFADLDAGDDLDPEFDNFDEGGAQGDGGGGLSRTFIIIAAALVGLFVIGLVGLLLFALQGGAPNELEMTATAIVLTNAAVADALAETETAAFNIGGTETAIAMTPTEVPPSPTNTRPPTNTPVPASPTPSPVDPTDMAATQFVLGQTATESFLQTQAALPTDTPAGPDPVEAQNTAIALTATALADVFNGLTQTAQAGGGGGQLPQATDPPGLATPTALPEAGLFDEFVGGGNSLTFIALAAFGLLGVIFFSRRMRTRL